MFLVEMLQDEGGVRGGVRRGRASSAERWFWSRTPARDEVGVGTDQEPEIVELIVAVERLP